MMYVLRVGQLRLRQPSIHPSIGTKEGCTVHGAMTDTCWPRNITSADGVISVSLCSGIGTCNDGTTCKCPLNSFEPDGSLSLDVSHPSCASTMDSLYPVVFAALRWSTLVACALLAIACACGILVLRQQRKLKFSLQSTALTFMYVITTTLAFSWCCGAH